MNYASQTTIKAGTLDPNLIEIRGALFLFFQFHVFCQLQLPYGTCKSMLYSTNNANLGVVLFGKD